MSGLKGLEVEHFHPAARINPPSPRTYTGSLDRHNVEAARPIPHERHLGRDPLRLLVQAEVARDLGWWDAVDSSVNAPPTRDHGVSDRAARRLPHKGLKRTAGDEAR